MSASDHDKKTIDEQAALWLVRVSAADVSDQDITDLTIWLETSDAHQQAFDRAESVWLQADALRASPTAAEVPVQVTAIPQVINFMDYKDRVTVKTASPKKKPVNVFWLAMGALAAASVVLAILPKFMTPVTVQTYQTAKGETRELALSDGTHLHLNSDTRISVRLSPKNRKITLDQGELALNVVHDEKRPFVVSMGKQQLSDIGTEFNVLRNAGLITVTVKSGAVALGAVEAPVLKAGEQATIAEADGQVERKSVDSATAYAWENGEVVYKDQPLSYVVKDLNRYFKKPLVVDAQAGQLKLSAVINLDSEASVVKRLQAFLPVDATSTDMAITLHKRP